MIESQRNRIQPETIPFFFRKLRPGSARCLTVGALALLLSFGSLCTSPRDSFFTTTEANERIALAFVLKDQECSSSHVITVPVLAPARMQDVDTCVIGILDTDCTDWVENDPTPDECRSLQINLLQ